MKENEEMADNSELEAKSEDIDEFDSINEAELGKALGEEIATEDTSVETSVKEETEPAKNDELSAVIPTKEPETVVESESAKELVPEQKASDEADKSVENSDLISKISGMDPIALRKLLAGAQVNISITFPKD